MRNTDEILLARPETPLPQEEPPSPEGSFLPQKEIEWGEDTRGVVCTFNRCGNGHFWAAKLALGECPGCHTSVLAVKMEQCPFCNEPIERTEIRTDLVSKGMGLSGMCKGEASKGEVQVIELERTHAKDAERGMGGCGIVGGEGSKNAGV